MTASGSESLAWYRTMVNAYNLMPCALTLLSHPSNTTFVGETNLDLVAWRAHPVVLR
jgi:hypothetical protein